ncbi:nose resistant to fluoxetine protein 6-like [Ischnura elegans]|uniref:nose resistant to fluoxetine protein 6-like n=1 Tax=Ischnura elegans TaxID=197161 RepID=UPI001ED8BB90|nr:nose resistant to fluoxetine protein 6-like [Ischnura elegans]
MASRWCMVATVLSIGASALFPAIIASGDGGSEYAVDPKDPGPLWNVYQLTMETMAVMGSSKTCRNQTADYLSSLANFTTWAVQMFDAGAKLPGGIISGNYYRLGDFDECVWVRGRDRKGATVAGQYCLASVQLTEDGAHKAKRLSEHHEGFRSPFAVDFDPMVSAWEVVEYKGDKSKHRRDRLKWGFCLPSSCSSTDLETALNHVLQRARPALGILASATVDESLCTVEEPVTLSGYDYMFCFLAAFLLLLNITSTIWDIKQQHANEMIDDGKYASNCGLLLKIFTCFSLRKIFVNLPQKKGNAGGLNMLFGLRVISMAYIILGHCVLNVIQGPIMNAEMIERGNRNPSALWLLHGDLVVDTFFTSGAFLLAYFLLLELDKRPVSALKLIFFRYVRLTPTVLFIVLFYASLLNKMGSGPFWNSTMNRERDNCQENWWTNVLYVNNYVNPDKMCVLQSWYLPCDTHFFILAIPLLQLLHSRPRIGFFLMMTATVVSVAIPAIITYVYRLDATVIFYLDSFFENFSLSNKLLYDVYYPSHSRAGPYMAGLIAGFFHYWVQVKEKKIPKVAHITMFLAGLALVIGPIYYAGLFYTPDRPYYPVEAALYAGLNRFIWGVGIALLIISMSSGYLGLLGDIFSHKIFIVLGKLTYSAYLVHFVFQLVLIGMRRNPTYVSIYDMVGLWLVNLIMTYGASLFLYMMIECPFRDLATLAGKR